jgi:hypothetical protein
MTAHNAMMTPKGSFVGSYDFSKAKHVVDVGGGYGNLLTAILLENSNLIGTDYDLVHSHAPIYFIYLYFLF